MDTLEDRAGKLTAEDRLEIQELMAAYNSFEDQGDFTSWAALFTQDGSFYPDSKKSVHGKEELADFQRARWDQRPEVRSRTHWGGIPVITATAEGADAKSYQMTIDPRAEGFAVNGISVKQDELRREDGRWRFFSRRVIRITHS